MLSLAVLLLAGAGGRAEAQCRALLVEPASAELMQRIEGQSRDVPCELSRAPAGERALDDEEACRALAREHGVDGVVRVVESAGGAARFEVVVCGREQRSERRAVQAKSASSDALSESALYEAVALVVRSALVDLAAAIEEAERARVEEARRAREEEERAREEERRARDDVERARVEQARRAREEEERARAEYATVDLYRPPSLAHPHWLIMVGGELASTGADRAALELGARAGVDLGVLQVGLFGAYGSDAPLRDASTELRLARHRLGVFAGIPLALTRALSFEVLLDAGVAALERASVIRTGPNVTATAARTTWSALLGVELALALRLAGPLGLRLHGGLDVLPGAPSYVYEDVRDGGTTTTEHSPRQLLQPRAGMMLFGSF